MSPNPQLRPNLPVKHEDITGPGKKGFFSALISVFRPNPATTCGNCGRDKGIALPSHARHFVPLCARCWERLDISDVNRRWGKEMRAYVRRSALMAGSMTSQGSIAEMEASARARAWELQKQAQIKASAGAPEKVWQALEAQANALLEESDKNVAAWKAAQARAEQVEE